MLFEEEEETLTCIVLGYGMTEVVILSHITTLDSATNAEIYGSCGKLLPGFEAKVWATVVTLRQK